MPRRSRFTIPDGVYHVMVRGNNRNDIFHNEEDFRYYTELIRDAKNKYRLKLYHYVFMNNHVHLMLRAADGSSLSNAIKSINVGYTVYYRKRYKGVGHFFQDRFKSCLIQSGKYMLECGKYIELNPVKAGIVDKAEDYSWSSYRSYVNGLLETVIDKSPEYEGLSENKRDRERIYSEYINGETDDFKEDKAFRDGAYGAEEYLEELKRKGLKPVLMKPGRPRKENNEELIINN